MELKTQHDDAELGQMEKEDEAEKIEQTKVGTENMEESKADGEAFTEDSAPASPVPPVPPEDLENGNVPKENAASSGPDRAAKVTVDRSLRSSIPAITRSVISAAKNVSFTSRSTSSFDYKAGAFRTPGHMKIVDIILRSGGAVLSLIAFSVMVANTEKRSGAGSTFKMKFSDYQAYNYLVALNVISFVYSCGQLILLGQSNGSNTFSSPFKRGLSIYICDQVLAFLLFSASSSAATASQLSRHGLHNIWPPACSTWKLFLFCEKADVAVVMSFFTSVFVILSSLYSGYYLSKLLAE